MTAPSVDQPLRWKGRWHFGFGSDVELYDMRARWWAPQVGTFLKADDFLFASSTTTLWGWPGENPMRWGDSSGHFAGELATGASIGEDILAGGTSVAAIGSGVGVGLLVVAYPVWLIANDIFDYQHPTIMGNGGQGRPPCPEPGANDEGFTPSPEPQMQAAAGGAGMRSGGGRSGRGRVDKVKGPDFPDLRDHAARHGNGLSTNAYYNEAVAHTETGTAFRVYHDGEFKQAYITRLGSDLFQYTATDLSGNTIFTHMS